MFQRYVLTPMLCMTLLYGTTAHAACGPSEKIEYGSAIAKIDKVLAVAQTLRDRIDRTSFDLDAVLDKTNYEATEIVEFVKHGIAFEQYPGLLRGPQGTLMSRAGNALDQSVLLARLLKDAGYDARVSRTTLSPSEAQRLLRETFHPRAPEPPIAEGQAILDTMEALGIPRQLSAGEQPLDASSRLDATSFPGHQDVIGTIDLLTEQLGNRAFKSSKTSVDPFIEEARTYYWVQYRDDIADGWQNVHPAFNATQDFQPEPETFYADTVPAELQHKLSFQVFIEYASRGELHVQPISQPWERPVANLTGQPLVFGNITNNMASDPSLSINPGVELEKASWFLPVFGTQSPPGASYFDLRGSLIDPMATGSPAASIVKTVGDLFARATDELDAQAVPRLTAQWLEFTMTSPDGTERTYRRTTMDRIGPAARKSGNIPANLAPPTAEELGPLLQRHTIMVATGRTSAAAAVDATLKTMIESRPLMDALLRNAAGEELDPRRLDRMLQSVPNYWTGHLALLSRFDLASTMQGVGTLYRSAPALVAHRLGPSANGGTIEAVDVLQNPRRSFIARDGEAAPNPEGVMRAGVWDTAVEGSLLAPGAGRENTALAFTRATAADAAIKLVQSADDLSRLSLPEDTIASMRADLESGNTLVVAEHDVEGVSGWWRVNPVTGETIGQIGDGRGSEIVEGIVLAISVGLYAISLINCGEAYDPETLADVNSSQAELVCCGFFSTVLFAFGAMIGIIHWTVGAVYDSMTSFMPYPSGCGRLLE